MTDHYLKFASEAEAVATMGAAGLAVEGVIPEGPVWVNDERIDIHTVGIIYDMVDEDAVAQDGWHINIRGPLPDELTAYTVSPATPRAVWA